MKQKSKTCELCSDPATVYCAADTAYLCYACDSAVHSANFLVARHVRWTRCATCGCALLVSGPGSDPVRHVCRTCGSDPVTPSCCPAAAESDASSCVSDRDEKKEKEKKRKKREDEMPRGRRVRRRYVRCTSGEDAAVLSVSRARRRAARKKEGWAESD